MRIRFRVLPLAALMMASVSTFAASDPFDAELFLSPYGEVAAPSSALEPVSVRRQLGRRGAPE